MLLINVFVFIFGSLIGSFLNVVIYRMPRGESVIFPRSKCRECKYIIPWYLNIPIFSFIFAKGKCRNCSTKISPIYPFTELFMAVIAVLIFPYQITEVSLMTFFIDFSIIAALYSHFLIDLEHQILPDKINLYLLLVVLPISILTTPMEHWLIGGGIGFFAPLIVTWVFYKLRGVVGLGGGDIKLYGVLGVILGPFGILVNIFMSCFLGSLVGLGLILFKKMGKDTPIPFGPSIILVFIVQYFFPDFFSLINPFAF